MTPINYNDPNDMWRNNGYDPYKGMSDDERMKAGCFQVVVFFVMIMLGFALCALFSSCTTTKYVPVPEYHTDTVRIVQHQRDSIYLSDSIYVNDFVRDDTVYKTIERWRTKYIERTTHDTLYQSKVDSIPYPVEVTKEVPAKLTWWQQARLHIINVLMMFGIIWLIVWIGKKHLGKL